VKRTFQLANVSETSQQLGISLWTFEMPRGAPQKLGPVLHALSVGEGNQRSCKLASVGDSASVQTGKIYKDMNREEMGMFSHKNQSEKTGTLWLFNIAMENPL